tara:strand:- start:479 stop:631 length:153 start_codon:yes stop_codon:yes gene_type:complete
MVQVDHSMDEHLNGIVTQTVDTLLFVVTEMLLWLWKIAPALVASTETLAV